MNKTINMFSFSDAAIHFWDLFFFTFLAISIAFLVLISSWFLGGRTSARHKNIPFESGITSVGSARVCLSIKFYLVAMFFVIFDVEELYLFIWSVSVRESGLIGFIEVVVFVLVLLGGLIYLARTGALNWGPLRRTCSKRTN